MRSWICGPRTLLLVVGLAMGSRSAAAEEPKPAPDRPLHLLVSAGAYAAAGGPASYGPSLNIEVLPGHFAGRFGVRGEWRGYKGYTEGSAILSMLYEAGASRPQLAMNLVAELGLTDDREPIVGGGVETSLWVLGPVGFTSLTDLQLIVDGLGTRPALSFSLAVHLGR